jgi:hypothetical protein
LIKSIGVIVPRRLRADWRQEWEAELRSREALLAEWDKLNWGTKIDLLRRSLGAFRDALLLQPRRLEEEMFQDLRYGARMMAKNPGFTLIAIITLALGIGANTAIFSMVKSVLIRPLPFAESDRLMQALYLPGPSNPPDDTLGWIARSDLVDWRARGHSFKRIGGYWNASLILPGEGAPEFIRGASVTYDLLPMLGVQPALGRHFLPEEGKPGGERLIILSDDLWRSRFGADPGIIGRTIRANGGIYVVVGVMPPGFNFPLRLERGVIRFPSRQTGFWMLSLDDLSGKSDKSIYNVILQLKSGVGAEQAQAELETLFAQRVQDNPQEHDRNFTAGVRLVALNFVSSNYLGALGVHLLRGRFFTADDSATSIPVAVISETAAQRFWNGEDPIGKRFSFSFGKPDGQGIWRQVVGVVKSTRHTGLDKEPRAEVYVPIEQQSWSQDMLFVRSSLPKADVARIIRQAVAAVDRNQAIYFITSMEDLLSDSVSARRFTMSLLGGFSALALALAMMGVYGVVSYGVAQRAPEIGVRIALGAQGRDVLRMMLAQGLKPVVIGSVIGLVAALALSRALSSLLYGVTATDPATFAIVVLLLLFAALLACYLPARQATRVDPIVALRQE